jgi:hypothetical protein
MTFIKKTLNVASLVAMTTAVHPQTFTRKPFLQKGSYNRASICWRVSAATSLTVKYGTDSTNLSMTSPPSASAADACVALDTATLQPATKYFYEVYNGATKLTGSARQYFITAPAVGSKKKSTFWILGDPGSAGTAQTNVKNAFNKVNQGAPIDGIITLTNPAPTRNSTPDCSTSTQMPWPPRLSGRRSEITKLWPPLQPLPISLPSTCPAAGNLAAYPRVLSCTTPSITPTSISSSWIRK